jgi:adenine-specific DNA-methyltransferase
MKVNRLNYIGSKFQLLDWLDSNIKEKTGWASFAGKRVGDLFAGTGIVSHYFRSKGAITLTNDAELYSSIISEAFGLSLYTPACEAFIKDINADIVLKKHTALMTIGYIQANYSPHGDCKRMFFTVENAARIDYIRSRIELAKDTLSPAEHTFLLASLLLSADTVSNVPAVYGCFLKKFKAKAEKLLILAPIHTNSVVPLDGSKAYYSDVLSQTLLDDVVCDAVYLDPPYNERQYSKNYFPLNMIAKTAAQQAATAPLKGVTGIPSDCFISPFCKKTDVKAAFKKLVGGLKSEWVFISYSSESLIPKDEMVALLKAYGEVSVVERDYKRFKAYEYNEDKKIMEFLFCLKKQCAP